MDVNLSFNLDCNLEHKISVDANAFPLYFTKNLDDVLTLIFQNLDTYSKATVAAVCKKWNKQSSENIVWQMEASMLPENVKTNADVHYKSEIRNRKIVDQIHKFVAFLEIFLGHNRWCHGILIGEGNILTTAHNVYNKSIKKPANSINCSINEKENLKPKKMNIPRHYYSEEHCNPGECAIITLKDNELDQPKHYSFLNPTHMSDEELLGNEIIVFRNEIIVWKNDSGHSTSQIIKLTETSQIIKLTENDFIYNCVSTENIYAGSPIFLKNQNEYTLVGLHFGTVFNSQNEIVGNTGVRLNEKRINWIKKNK